MNAQLRLVFVDDEPRLLAGLERMLHGMRGTWAMRFAGSPGAALATLADEPADVVISDMRMPGQTGGELLNEVMRRWPSSIRIILSGHADRAMIERTIGPTHQFLQKPCDTDTLKATIQRVQRLRGLLGNDRLQGLVAGTGVLPSLPALYLELVDLLQRPDATIEQISAVVTRDIAMSARVLQLVNSAFYAPRRSILSPREAVGVLGTGTLRTLALTVHAFESLAGRQRMPLDTEALWSDSMRCSALARRIAVDAGLDALQSEAAALAGALHDIGRLILAIRCPTGFAELCRRIRGPSDHLLERTLLGCTHSEVGACLLGLWGIADTVVEAVALHHDPQRAGAEPGPAACVCLAVSLLASSGAATTLDFGLAEALGWQDLVPAWSSAAASLPEVRP